MVRHLPPTFPHPWCPLYPRNRLDIHASLPNIHLWRNIHCVRCRRRHSGPVFLKRCTERDGCWLVHPHYRRYPLGSLFHIRRRLSLPSHLQYARNRWSYPPFASSPNTHAIIHAQYAGRKRISNQLFFRRRNWLA